MRGASFEFHSSAQGFDPNDRMAYGLYEALGAIALFRTGHRQRRRGTRRRRHPAQVLQPHARGRPATDRGRGPPRILKTTRPAARTHAIKHAVKGKQRCASRDWGPGPPAGPASPHTALPCSTGTAATRRSATPPCTSGPRAWPTPCATRACGAATASSASAPTPLPEDPLRRGPAWRRLRADEHPPDRARTPTSSPTPARVSCSTTRARPSGPAAPRRAPRGPGGSSPPCRATPPPGFLIHPRRAGPRRPGRAVRPEGDLRAGPDRAALRHRGRGRPPGHGTPYGLAAGLQTRDLTRTHRVAARLRAGSVWISAWPLLNAAIPFVGYGRDSWPEGLDAYLQSKSVAITIGGTR